MSLNADTSTPGGKIGNAAVATTSKAVAGSGLSDTDLGPQSVSMIGYVYAYAAPETIASPGYVGKFFRGAAITRALTVSNPVGAFTEGLDASFGGPSGGIIPGGAIANLIGSDSTSMILALDTSAAGAKNGVVPVSLTSNGANSGLASTPLGSQDVSMSGEVYDHGVASTKGATLSDTINLELTARPGETATAAYSIYNLMQTLGFTGGLDLLGFSGVGDTDKLASGLSAFAGLAAGDFASFTASLNASTLGIYSADYTLDLADAAGDGIGGDVMHQTLYVHLSGTVVPEPSTIVFLLTAAVAGLIGLRRRFAAK